VGYGLAIGGFVAKAPEQPDSALTAIRGVVGLGPAIFALLGALMFLAYPLTDARFREIVKELHARQGIRDQRDVVVESADAIEPIREQ
jgi:Na+/melibiose symporter-like transporter